MELAQRCLTGDAGALREFVEVYRPAVFALCFRMMQHHQDAEDTTQEALVRALRYLGSWDPSQPLTPWVMKIATNRCRTNLGRRSRSPAVWQSMDNLAEEKTEGESLGEEIERALTFLVDHQRECFSLFYQNEYSISEIAAIMRVPEGTVKTWLHRGRRQLARHLQERGVMPQQRTRENDHELR